MTDVFNGSVVVTGNEYRICMVGNRKALFHRWEEFCNVVEASPFVGGAPAGQIRYISGIVEFEDGTVSKVLPSSIRFLDSKFTEEWEGQASRVECTE